MLHPTSIVRAVRAALARGASALRAACRRPRRAEAAALGMGVLAMAIATGTVVGDAATRYAALRAVEADLRAIVASAGFDAAICPDGWAADHAPIVEMTEAEVTAWYLREALERSDADVSRHVARWIAAPTDFRLLEGPALTYTQIQLCIAESRRMI